MPFGELWRYQRFWPDLVDQLSLPIGPLLLGNNEWSDGHKRMLRVGIIGFAFPKHGMGRQHPKRYDTTG